jgi:transposase, IS5 family
LNKTGKNQGQSSATEVRKSMQLKEQINLKHPLVLLAHAIDWDSLSHNFSVAVSSEGGRPALDARLMVGLHYLKALYDESNESVVSKWVENPYWQYFCGEVEFQHEIPCHPTSLVKWGKRVGSNGMEQLLKHVSKQPCSVMLCLTRTLLESQSIPRSRKRRSPIRPMQDCTKARRTLVRATRQH